MFAAREDQKRPQEYRKESGNETIGVRGRENAPGSEKTVRAFWRIRVTEGESARTMSEIVDLHTHILPGMDDGSKSAEMSLEMLRALAQAGVTTVCGTSHYYANQNDTAHFCARRERAVEALRAAMPAGETLPRVLPAAEVAYFPHMEEHRLERLCVEHTRTLLLEMPFAEWTDLQAETVATLALDQKFRVILVHPERFCFSKGNRRKLERLVELPIGLQVNAASLMRWRTRKLSLELLELTDLPLLGSDCHNTTTRPPNLKGGRDIVQRKLGEAFLAQMDENAQRITVPCLAEV